MKKLISIFLLFIICIQCLPVKELGKCLYDNSFVEEDVCGKSVNKNLTKSFQAEFYFTGTDEAFVSLIPNSHLSRKNSELALGPVTDVTTPPPNSLFIS